MSFGFGDWRLWVASVKVEEGVRKEADGCKSGEKRNGDSAFKCNASLEKRKMGQ